MSEINTDDLKYGGLLENAVSFIGAFIELATGSNPADNSGAEYGNDVFQMAAYDWSERRDWNFRWRDFEMSWYKYMGRGVSVNRPMSPSEIRDMVKECIGSIE